jgi:queuine tRNA-ribosyltransferase
MEPRELRELGADIVLSNAYHLYLRPGMEILEKAGGLHRFMGWDGPILVDSGGFQVFSLAEIRKVAEEGVRFQSHIDGSYHLFSPEKVIKIQRSIGPDFVMPLDELVGWPATREEADSAAERTWRWLQRGLEAFAASQPKYGYEQTLLPIVQGSFYPDLREREARRLAELNADAYAIGGLAVGEERNLTADAVDIVTGILPDDKPRYAMGVGFPWDILDAVSRGVDLFDCVVPTRNGRNATLFTWHGPMNLRNKQYEDDFTPVDPSCGCYCCRHYSRAYLRHLYHAKEILALKLGTAHNLHFYFDLLRTTREHLHAGSFQAWLPEVQEKIGKRQ